MPRFFMVAAAVLCCAAMANAQTKVSGTAQCSKPDSSLIIPVGDRSDHMMAVVQYKCTWTKPMEIGGDKSKDGVSTETGEISANTSRARGFHVATMESGDKAFFWYQGTATTKDGAIVEGKGNWGLNGGSGKLKGSKGKGTYTCAPSGEMLSCDIEGEYQLAK